jgi:hypothetical protein
MVTLKVNLMVRSPIEPKPGFALFHEWTKDVDTDFVPRGGDLIHLKLSNGLQARLEVTSAVLGLVCEKLGDRVTAHALALVDADPRQCGPLAEGLEESGWTKTGIQNVMPLVNQQAGRRLS